MWHLLCHRIPAKGGHRSPHATGTIQPGSDVFIASLLSVSGLSQGSIIALPGFEMVTLETDGKAHTKRPGSEFRAVSHSNVSADQFIVGMTNSAPSLTPDGQRDVTVLVLV